MLMSPKAWDALMPFGPRLGAKRKWSQATEGVRSPRKKAKHVRFNLPGGKAVQGRKGSSDEEQQPVQPSKVFKLRLDPTVQSDKCNSATSEDSSDSNSFVDMTVKEILDVGDKPARDCEDQELRASLTCPICIDIFYRPCTLKCGHSFCRSCIVRHDVETKSCAQGKEKPCPTCRAPTVDSSGLTESVTLKSLVSRSFPQHVERCDRLDLLRGKRLWLGFLQSRNKLVKLKSQRDSLEEEVAALKRQLAEKQWQYKTVLNDCSAELKNAKALKGMLDNKAYSISVNDRQTLAALASPEEKLPEIDEILHKVENSCPL